MESVFSILVDDKIPGKETQPVLPPEYPVTKPDVNPEKEKGEPFHPIPEIKPAPQPEIKPGKI